MNRLFRTGLLPVVLLSAFLAAGCAKGPKIVKVSGTVTRQGRPVPNVALTFTPTEGRPSWGMADAEGKYNLKFTISQDGALVGTHRVSVEFPPASPREENDLATGRKQVSAERREILMKYGDKAKSPLTVEVKDDGKPVDILLD